MGWDETPDLRYASGWDPLESQEQSCPSHGTVGWDGMLGFGGMHLGGTHQNPMDSPVHPMGLRDGTGRRDLGVFIWVGHIRIPWTVPSIPWDCGMGQDAGIWEYASGWDTLEPHGQSRPSHGTVGWDRTPGFGGMHLCGTC